MKQKLITLFIFVFLIIVQVKAQKAFEFILNTNEGELAVNVLGHASFIDYHTTIWEG